MNNNNLNGDVNDINEKAQELFEQYRDEYLASELELEASLEEINQIYKDSGVLRGIILTCRKNSLRALNEAVDALGDILAGVRTEKQKIAYRLCVKTRDNLLKTPQKVVK